MEIIKKLLEEREQALKEYNSKVAKIQEYNDLAETYLVAADELQKEVEQINIAEIQDEIKQLKAVLNASNRSTIEFTDEPYTPVTVANNEPKTDDSETVEEETPTTTETTVQAQTLNAKAVADTATPFRYEQTNSQADSQEESEESNNGGHSVLPPQTHSNDGATLVAGANSQDKEVVKNKDNQSAVKVSGNVVRF